MSYKSKLAKACSPTSITAFAKVTVAATAVWIGFWPASLASASGLATLYSFCPNGGYCVDGDEPEANLIVDAAGNLYGTTIYGGRYGGGNAGGTVFELLAPSSGKRRWIHKVLHNFTVDEDPLSSPLIMDIKGNLYGTAEGGPTGGGFVYELQRESTRWKFKIVYEFCRTASCPDGGGPNAFTYGGASTGALYDGVSTLYGTTYGGGTNNVGTVYSLTPSSGRKQWSEQVLYSFCSQSGCPYYPSPGTAPVMDASGNLYTATSGGLNDAGAVVELSPGTPWTETDLHDFCGTANCGDGGTPLDSLLIDTSGNLYGTTFDASVVFELASTGGGQFQYSILYSFCQQTNCADGLEPYAGLTMDSSGDLFGTTYSGGNGQEGSGVVFELSPGFNDLYLFCSQPRCTDGFRPYSGVTIGAGGNLFGTTQLGGAYGLGTVYELTP